LDLLDDDVPDVYHSCCIGVVCLECSFSGSPRTPSQHREACIASAVCGCGRLAATKQLRETVSSRTPSQRREACIASAVSGCGRLAANLLLRAIAKHGTIGMYESSLFFLPLRVDLRTATTAVAASDTGTAGTLFASIGSDEGRMEKVVSGVTMPACFGDQQSNGPGDWGVAASVALRSLWP